MPHESSDESVPSVESRRTSALRRLLMFLNEPMPDSATRLVPARNTVVVVATVVTAGGLRVRCPGGLLNAGLPYGTAEERRRTAATLKKLRQDLAHALARLFPVDGFGSAPGGSVDIPVLFGKGHLQRHNAGPLAPVEVWLTATSWRDAFWMSFAGLLEEFGPKLRRCPRERCQKLFVRHRKQIFCSSRCAGAARAQRFYARERRESGRRSSRRR